MRRYVRRLSELERKLRLTESGDDDDEIPLFWVDLTTGERRRAPTIPRQPGGKIDYRLGLVGLYDWAEPPDAPAE